jgi:hypothetical protein
VTKGCDNEAGNGKAGAMDDEFETQPGGGHRQAAEGGGDDARPLDLGDEMRGRGPDDRDIAGGMDRPFDSDIDGDFDGDDGIAEGESSGDVLAAGAFGDEFGEPRVPTWVGAVTGAALGLVAVQALILLGTLAQAMAVERFQGDSLHKIGIALLSNVGSANGLTLLVAAVVAALPAILGAPMAVMHRRRLALVFGVGAVLAVILVLGTPLAVRARIHVLDAGGQTVDSLARRVLATYVAGTLGTALVALGACLGLSRYSKNVTPRP